jgi:hypothetical protein
MNNICLDSGRCRPQGSLVYGIVNLLVSALPDNREWVLVGFLARRAFAGSKGTPGRAWFPGCMYEVTIGDNEP